MEYMNDDAVSILTNLVKKNYSKLTHARNTHEIISSRMNILDNREDLVAFIGQHLKPKDIEKKQNGEVFTPPVLINQQFDKLTEVDPSVWTDPSKKFLDPANGIGNYPALAFHRLMDGLSTSIPDEYERKKHILENMLYMCELNRKNVEVSKKLFDPENEFNLNVHCGSFLELDTEEVWGVENFDVIMGNPPYNSGGIRSHTGKQLGEKNITLWPSFIKLSFQLLKLNGYLLYITPLSWLKKSHSCNSLMTTKHIHWLILWDNIKAKKTINAKIPLSLYIIQNTSNYHKFSTYINSVIDSKKTNTTSNIYIEPHTSIPLAFHSIFKKLKTFIQEKNCKIDYHTKTITSIGKRIAIPQEYSIEDNLAVDTYRVKDGLFVKKTNERHPDASKRKIIIANKSSFNGAFIDEGKLGLTGSDKLYVLSDNPDLILKILKFKIADIISHYTKYRQDFLEKDTIEYIPDLQKIGITNITEEEFYTLIGLSQEEVNML